MESTQQFSLRWNNYLRHLTYSLDSLRLNDEFVDVSLCVDGRKIRAHKVVLSACSTFFKDIFKENPQPHHVIVFKLVSFQDLSAIIEFMYQGQVNVRQDALKSFLQTAALLAVQGLTSEDHVKSQYHLPPIINEDKLIKTIPSTIRPLNEPAATTMAQTQTSTQMLEMSMEQVQASSTQQYAMQNILQQQQQQQQQQHHRQNVQVTQAAAQLHVQQATQTNQQQPLAMQNQLTAIAQQQQLRSTQQHVTLTSALPLQIASNANKKRKLTYTADDDNNITMCTTATIDGGSGGGGGGGCYTSKDEQNVVKIYSKTGDMAFLRDAPKLDIPEYIVTDMEDRLSDEAVSPASRDDAIAVSDQTVHQYSSEYEILTESELDDKVFQAEQQAHPGGIMEMGELLATETQLPTSGIVGTQSASTHEHDAAAASSERHNESLLQQVNKITDNSNKCVNTPLADATHSKWAECQFCKMIITTVNLWRHIRTQHTPQPPRKCELCHKNFKNKYSLREHIRISHEQKIAIKIESN